VEFSKEYEEYLQNGNKMKVKIAAKIEHADADTQETVSTFAAISRRFYFDLANEIKRVSQTP